MWVCARDGKQSIQKNKKQKTKKHVGWPTRQAPPDYSPTLNASGSTRTKWLSVVHLFSRLLLPPPYSFQRTAFCVCFFCHVSFHISVHRTMPYLAVFALSFWRRAILIRNVNFQLVAFAHIGRCQSRPAVGSFEASTGVGHVHPLSSSSSLSGGTGSCYPTRCATPSPPSSPPPVPVPPSTTVSTSPLRLPPHSTPAGAAASATALRTTPSLSSPGRRRGSVVQWLEN
jgi:hypothetical protein